MKIITLIIFILSFNIYAKLKNPKISYDRIVQNYTSMRGDIEKNKLKHNYIRFIRNFSTFNKIYQNHYNPYKENAKFYIAKIYSDLAFVSGTKSDFIIAFNRINNFIEETTDISLIKQANHKKNELYEWAKANNIPQITDNEYKKKEFGTSLSNSLTKVFKVLQFKNSITVHTDKKINYLVSSSEDINTKKISIEILNTKLNNNNFNSQLFKDSKIKGLKIYQHNYKIVRIDFYTDKILFPIVTITKEGKKTNFAMRTWDIAKKAREELNRKFKVLIDPGHGGKDPGSIKNGIKEKDLTLAISKKLGSILEKENIEVFYTRTKDITLSLDERAEKAKDLTPDIFISIHLNSSKSIGASGIETYYFDVKSDKTTNEIASRENQNGGPLSDLDFILQDLIISKNFLDAGKLAANVHDSLIQGITNSYDKKIINRGTRGGPFYILYKTGVPSILIESGFISNRKEAKILKTKSHQLLIAKQISTGLKKYIETIK